MRILGVDPGLSGALALYDPDKTVVSGMRWIVEDMPIAGDPSEVNVPALRDWLRRHAPEHAFVERVSAMPSIPGKDGIRRGMGATSAFRFGGTFYTIKAVLACVDVPISLVTPAAWKRSHDLKGSDKEASRLRALQLFPGQGETLRLKKHENRAEAMLIAYYGWERQRARLMVAAE